jgi:xanthine dehydrogenase accessory factor
MKELQAIVKTLNASPKVHAALATLVTVEGSSYRRPGARLLLTAEGNRVGSISGGCLEEDVLSRARRVMETGVAEAVVYDTTSENDLVWGVGLGCHGVVRVLIEKLEECPAWAKTLADHFAARCMTTLAVVHDSAEPNAVGTRLATEHPNPATIRPGVFYQDVRPPTPLFVFGAGDDALPLVRLAKEIGWHVTVADPRAAFATRERFSPADVVLAAPAADLVTRLKPGPDALAVVMTHHYVHDVPIAGALLQRPLTYLGLLGPKKRAEKILSDLAAQGIAPLPSPRQHVHSPVGLDLGADAPEQVALAIVAEMQAVLTGRNARPLRERTLPIHA